jgi:hypothetical protein
LSTTVRGGPFSNAPRRDSMVRQNCAPTGTLSRMSTQVHERSGVDAAVLDSLWGDSEIIALRRVAFDVATVSGQRVSTKVLRQMTCEGYINTVRAGRGGAVTVTRAEARRVLELCVFALVGGLAVAAVFRGAKDHPEMALAAGVFTAGVLGVKTIPR